MQRRPGTPVRTQWKMWNNKLRRDNLLFWQRASEFRPKDLFLSLKMPFAWQCSANSSSAAFRLTNSPVCCGVCTFDSAARCSRNAFQMSAAYRTASSSSTRSACNEFCSVSHSSSVSDHTPTQRFHRLSALSFSRSTFFAADDEKERSENRSLRMPSECAALELDLDF